MTETSVGVLPVSGRRVIWQLQKAQGSILADCVALNIPHIGGVAKPGDRRPQGSWTIYIYIYRDPGNQDNHATLVMAHYAGKTRLSYRHCLSVRKRIVSASVLPHSQGDSPDYFSHIEPNNYMENIDHLAKHVANAHQGLNP